MKFKVLASLLVLAIIIIVACVFHVHDSNPDSTDNVQTDYQSAQ